MNSMTYSSLHNFKITSCLTLTVDHLTFKAHQCVVLFIIYFTRLHEASANNHRILWLDTCWQCGSRSERVARSPSSDVARPHLCKLAWHGSMLYCMRLTYSASLKLLWLPLDTSLHYGMYRIWWPCDLDLWPLTFSFEVLSTWRLLGATLSPQDHVATLH